ncbi:MAG: hypothetical protein DRP64_14960, partial [Verrucomicrobia bacterium]
IDAFSDYDPAGAGIYDTGSGWSIPGSATGIGITIAEAGLTGTLGSNRTTTYTGVTHAKLSLFPDSNLAILDAYLSSATVVYSYSGFSIDLTTGTKLVLDFEPDQLTYETDAVISMTIGDGTDVSTVTHDTWDALPENPGRFDLDFLVADYTGVDITAITSISLSIESSVAGDYGLYGISTDAIPEPATLGLVGLTTLGLLFRRRKMFHSMLAGAISRRNPFALARAKKAEESAGYVNSIKPLLSSKEQARDQWLNY